MIKMITRLCSALMALALAQVAVAQDWTPPGPVKLMIGFRAGGGADTQARLIAEALEDSMGWQFIPEQVTGKGGAVLAAALKDEPNDGTAIGMIVTESLGYNMAAAGNAGYNLSDFMALTTTAGFQMAVCALSSRGWTTFDDVIAAAKAGESIRFGVMSPKLADLAYLLGKANGVEFNIVMMQGGKGVMDGLNAGDIDIGWGAGIQTNAVLAGDMVQLVSGISRPLELSPEAPLLSDLGVEYNADGYFMFVAPDGLPDEARIAFADAISGLVMEESTPVGGFLKKGFGGATVIAGDSLDAFLADELEAAHELLEAASAL